MPRCYELAHIVGISKTTYVLATPRCLEWRHDLQRTSTNTNPSDSDSQVPCRRPAYRHRGDRRSPWLPVAGLLVLEIDRSGPRSAAQHGVAGTWPSRVRPNRTVAGPRRPEPARGSDRKHREGDDGLSRAPRPPAPARPG